MRLKRVRISAFRSIGVHAQLDTLSPSHVHHTAKAAAADFDPDEFTPTPRKTVAKPRRAANKPAYAIKWDTDAFCAELPYQPRAAGHMMSAIMGPNSAGKSTILLALNLFFSNLNKLDEGYFHQHADAPIIIEATFTGDVQKLDDLDPAWIEAHCTGRGNNRELTLASIWNSDGRRRLIRTGQGYFARQSNGDRAICDRLLPAFRMIWADSRPGEAAEFKRDSLLSDLVTAAFQTRAKSNGLHNVQAPSAAQRLETLLGQLRALLNRGDPPSAQPTTDHDAHTDAHTNIHTDWSALEQVEQWLSDGLAQLTPQQNRVRIRLDMGIPTLEDILAKGVTLIDDGAALAFDRHGLGLQRAFAISVLKAWCNSPNIPSRDYIFAVEEPEIYLHPHATRVMLRLLEDIAQNHQVIFTTHAGEFINRAPLQNLQIVSRRRVQDAWISQVQRPRFGKLKAEEIAKVQRYLSEDRSDMLFARAVLLVEGQAELFALPSFAATLGLDLDAAGVSVVFVNGIGNFGAYHQILRAFGIAHTILMDGDGKRAEREQSHAGMADALVVLDHDFERELVDALSPERRRQLADICLERRGKPRRGAIASGARGAQELANLGKPLVGRVAGEFCTEPEIRKMDALVRALQQTVELAR